MKESLPGVGQGEGVRPDRVLELRDVVVGAAKATSYHDHCRRTVVEPTSLSPFLCEQKRELREPCLLPGTKHLPCPPHPSLWAEHRPLLIKEIHSKQCWKKADLSSEVEN